MGGGGADTAPDRTGTGSHAARSRLICVGNDRGSMFTHRWEQHNGDGDQRGWRHPGPDVLPWFCGPGTPGHVGGMPAASLYTVAWPCSGPGVWLHPRVIWDAWSCRPGPDPDLWVGGRHHWGGRDRTWVVWHGLTQLLGHLGCVWLTSELLPYWMSLRVAAAPLCDLLGPHHGID